MAIRRLDRGDISSPRPTMEAAFPFVALATGGLLSVFLPPYRDGGLEPLVMVAVFAVALGLLAVSIRRDHRSWVDPASPFLVFLAVALARDLTGGAGTGLGPLVALPILWLAIIGTRRDVFVSVGLAAAVFVVPILTVGAPEYPPTEWRRALLWSAFAAFIGPAVHRIVRRLALESQKEHAVRAELDGIMRGARLSSMITTDTGGIIRSFGVGSAELLHYQADDMVGQQGLVLFHDPAEVEAIAAELGVQPGFAVFKELARRGSPSRIWTLVRADGGRIFAQLVVTELHDVDDVLTGYLAVAIDATAGIEAEHSLALSEARWRVLADHLPDITLMVVDEDLVIRVVSGAGAVQQGLAGVEGRSLSSVSNVGNMAVCRPLIAKAFEGQESAVELLASTTGAEHEIVVTALPTDAEGRRVLLIARDVSRDRAQARETLKAKERAERLFADAPHGVAVLTTSGVVTHVNGAMASIIGPIPGGIEGHTLSELASPGDDRLDRHLAEVLANRDERAETDWTLRHGDGHDVHVALSSRVLAESDTADDTVLVNVVDVSERHRFEQRLAHLADHDALTGLVNRRRFDEELTRHLAHGKRYGYKGALLLLVLDHFKDVNDALGHGAGDELIVSVAALLGSGVRDTDVVARLGGDEFAILLTDADLAGAEVVAHKIVDRVREHTAVLQGHRRHVTVSIGVVGIGVDSGQAADLLALADMTMYDAKDAGRDCCVAFDDTDRRRPRTGAPWEWKARLESAIENDAMVLHLQPILDLATGRIRSAEVLLRLGDSDELVHPERFVHIAERAGLMPRLDAWVIENSIAVLAQLRTYVPDFCLEVNVSGLSIGNPRIEKLILTCLREHEVDPSALILEITETAAVADVESAHQFAERMSALGCRFALDDFGAGFGSFYYLKHLLFDYVKIDGEFVANCHRSTVDRTILRSIVGIAHDLGKKTVAEYVASSEILEVVRDEGVDFAQGYLVGKPMSFGDFVAGPLAMPTEAGV
ncbi:EAL domain-containing protein [Aeromicrobium sp.]|uniref:sensor domain-containing protein n=1 Tax=Aeromicrobium sp. TaxID=1871063 RepID=UPI0019CAE046|nr:EAL domain-containing protein [Aeromicrobium sp.]MBC7632379.1 EAL domain-containing protein [Aeromicrobium sp.]